MSHHAHGGKIEEKFSPWKFIITMAVSLAGLCALVAIIAPGVWQAQLAASAWSFAIVFLVVHAAAGAFEFFFHRYILHAPLLPGLSRFYKQHTLHHALTRIGYQKLKKSDAEVPCLVDNNYPIMEEKQFEASYFPWYSMAVFTAVASVVLIPAQLLFPTAPMLLAGFLAVAWSLSLYELIHAVEHWPQETWNRLIENPRWGRFWRKAYAFHLRHHADIRCNEAISGIFGLPIVDLVLGTYVDPETLYPHGKPVDPAQFVSPRPRFAIIRWLDDRADAAVKKRRLARAG